MSKVLNNAERVELDEDFIYVSKEEEKEISEATPTCSVEQFCPRLDIEHLFKSRYRQLKGFIRKRVNSDQDAEDIVQSTYLEALKKAENYKGLSRPDVWLFGIALNLARNHSKKERNRSRVWEENFGHDIDESNELATSPCQLISNKQLLNKINNAVDTLPKEMAQVFKAVVIESKSYLEVAQSIGVPTGTVRSRLSRARDKLKEFSL